MEELQSFRKAYGMGNIVMVIFEKYNLASLLSDHNNSHPSHMQNTPLQDLPKLLSHYRIKLSIKTQDLII